jgi:hypothetical protein
MHEAVLGIEQPGAHAAATAGTDTTVSSSRRFGTPRAGRVEMGYYRIPRDATTAEIAAELDIERRTLEGDLRHARTRPSRDWPSTSEQSRFARSLCV